VCEGLQKKILVENEKSGVDIERKGLSEVRIPSSQDIL
jgi:hypothetical protein